MELGTCTCCSARLLRPDPQGYGMRFRTRLLFALVTLGLIPLIAVGFGVRREVERRLTTQYEVRAAGLAARVSDDLTHESATIARRLASLRQTMIDDNRFRLAI